MLNWEISNFNLEYNIDINEEVKSLFLDYLNHRFRILSAFSSNYLIPSDFYYKENRIILKFPINIEIISKQNGIEKNNEFQKWKNTELMPLLRTFIDAHNLNIVGFSQFKPIKGKFIPPITFFVGQYNLKTNEIEAQKKRDQDEFCNWIKTQSSSLLDINDTENRRYIDNLIKDIQKSDYDNINLYSDTIIKSSFLSILTEAEFFQKIREVYKYKIMPKKSSITYGQLDKDELLLEINHTFNDPIFGKIIRPTIQEIWDSLIEDRKISRLLVLTDLNYFPNPLISVNRKAITAELIKVHEDQPLIFIKKFKERIPQEGFLYIYEYGDLDQIRKKRKFIDYISNNRNLSDYLSLKKHVIKKNKNYWKRSELVNAIIHNEGIFAIQGPPGTGKTHLATEVIAQCLKQNPFAKILICSKEHLSLNHILVRTTELLESLNITFRAYRSLSTEKFRRSEFSEAINKYINASIIKGIASYTWTKSDGIWSKVQDYLPSEFDLRNKSIAETSANLFFCTTMDGAMYDLIENKNFDLAIIEEAGKCYPSELLHVLCLGTKVLMIGDQNQLPPYQIKETTESLRIWEKILEKSQQDSILKEKLLKRFSYNFKKINQYYIENGKLTLENLEWLKPFEYLFNILPEKKVHVLDEQYRMEKQVSDIIGNVFYNREFIHKKEKYKPLKGFINDKYNKILLWIDTPHVTKLPEAGEDPEKRGYRINIYELELVIAYLSEIEQNANIDFVILTPYNEQKNLFLDSEELELAIKKITNKKITEIIKTVDEYQGHEADLTIISLVRNNTLGAKSSWGFIIEPERLNVMFSRSKSNLLVIGCSEHIERNKQEKDLSYLFNFYTKFKEFGSFILSKEVKLDE